MPRIARIYNETSFFHVMTQGLNKCKIFKMPDEKKLYIKIMYKLAKELNIKIIAYCIMDNHSHMLLKVDDSSYLSKFMQRLNGKYALFYNIKYERVGYVFRDRYRAEGIYSEQYKYACINYIYENPVKAGICAKADEYLYSNYKKNSFNYIEEKYNFIGQDIPKPTIYEILNQLTSNNLNNLKKNKTALIFLIKTIKTKYHFSFMDISSALGISRETARKLFYS